MEKKTGSRSKKRKRRLKCVILPTQEPFAFSILLAATAASKSPFSSERRLLIKTCLNKYLKFLVALSKSSPSNSYLDLMNSTLALLPLLLKSRCAEIVSICAKIVGTTSLLSYEMNEEIASDGSIVKALLLSLFRVTVAAAPVVKKKKRVLATASLCNALLDLSITSFGRQRLLHFSAINYLIWEGFMHVALHHWSRKLIAPQHSSTGSFETCETASLNLLHAAVWHIGMREPSFRKACFVAAIPLSDFGEQLELSQRAMFSELIHKVYELSSFSDTVSHVRMVIGRDEDPFHRMRWLNHLSDNEMIEQLWDSPSKVFMKVLALVDQQECSMGAAFVHIKSKFCEEVVFNDVKESFRKLYAKYKKARDQYMKGMLSLHY